MKRQFYDALEVVAISLPAAFTPGDSPNENHIPSPAVLAGEKRHGNHLFFFAPEPIF